MITRDPRNEICRQLERAREDLEFSLYLATDCARGDQAVMNDHQYDEIKRNFDSVCTVLRDLKSR
ncbi:hypothetical protein FCL40_15975 [Ferrimonas sediminicola]|uniref:Uncharacterized protein n=1 Tax=Ferrimonas sediminicola TaxID=2569538 RepID=A0A4U1B9W3_9GAMM|nr:hypothetical protein [Ferrimonas sediminicola]TKB47346.1 hypothetical protein FCL40_15975 [Ferrimonas sediminicola]